MATSAFQFTTPLLFHLEFFLRPEPPTEEEYNKNEAVVNFGLNVSRSDDERKAAVDLRVQINRKEDKIEDKALYWVDMKMGALFKWEENVPDDQVVKLLNVNAPMLLISYMRPVIAQLTDMSPVPAYHIPFIDMTKLFMDKTAQDE